jgi:hypothetical protein
MHVPVETGIYKRANVKMIIELEKAMRSANNYSANKL